jgi:hypothetical protein
MNHRDTENTERYLGLVLPTHNPVLAANYNYFSSRCSLCLCGSFL